MKIEAGGKLWNRKPSEAPAVNAASAAAPPIWRSNAMIANATPWIVQSPCSQSVDSVREVHDVHHADQPDGGDHLAGIRELESPEEWERQVRDHRAALDHDQRRGDLAEQLRWAQGPGVVDRADQRDQARPGEERPGVHHSPEPGAASSVWRADRRRHPDHRRDQHPGEDRHATERGGGSLGQSPVGGHRERADPPRQPSGERREHRGDRHRHEEREDGIRIPHAVGEAWQGQEDWCAST